MKLLVRVAATTCVVLLAGGCSGSSSGTSSGSPTLTPPASGSASDSPSGHGTPATGVEVTGTGYTYHLPDGWQDISAQLKASQAGIDSGARAKPATPPFTANINTLLAPSSVQGARATAADVKAYAAMVKKEVVTLSPSIKTMAATTVGGLPAVHQEGPAKQGSSDYYLVQYFVLRRGNNVGFTFAFPNSFSATQRTQVVEPVLASVSFG